MLLEIFDVAHGSCALLTTDKNKTIMIDCARNSYEKWGPGTYLRDYEIDTLDLFVLTNFDNDHLNGAVDLFENVNVKSICFNDSVTRRAYNKMKSKTNKSYFRPSIERIFEEISNFKESTSSKRGLGVDTLKVFYNEYPEMQNLNNLSVVLFLKLYGVGVLFTGDLERSGWYELLDVKSFRQILSDVNLLVAPHHGRKDGRCSEALAEMVNLKQVVISDKYRHQNAQKTITYYGNYAKGKKFRGRTRKVITTRSDGDILFKFNPTRGWRGF